jgi:hypothetical protein
MKIGHNSRGSEATNYAACIQQEGSNRSKVMSVHNKWQFRYGISNRTLVIARNLCNKRKQVLHIGRTRDSGKYEALMEINEKHHNQNSRQCVLCTFTQYFGTGKNHVNFLCF